MNEQKLFVHPSKIKMEDRARQVYNQKELEELKQSILALGQLQPIIVKRDFSLVIGGRRTKACLDLDRDIWYSFADSEDDLWVREAELAENVHRSDFTPAEVVLMKDQLRQMREDLGEKATVRELSVILKESKSQTAEDLKLAAFVKAAPDHFQDCKTKTELRTKVRNLERKAKWNRLSEACSNLPHGTGVGTCPTPRKDHIAKKIQAFEQQLKIGDAYEELCKLPDNYCDIILLDPPYGIGKGGDIYDDSEDFIRERLSILLFLVFDKLADPGHLVCFFAQRFQAHVFEALTQTGLHVLERPIIVCKEGMGGNSPVPDVWPGAAYEPFFLARKGNRKLVARGRADWFTVKPLSPTEKMGHPNAKPPALYVEILSRIAYPGEKVCDPMYGTGAAFVACEMLPELKLQWFGWDNVKQNKAKALMALSQLIVGGTE